MRTARAELHDDLVATIAAGRELLEDHSDELASAYLDHLQAVLDRDGSVSGSQKESYSLPRFAEAVCGVLSGIVGLSALVHVHNTFTAVGPAMLGMGYGVQHGNAAFAGVMSVVNPFMVATALILTVVGTSAFVHSMYRVRGALWTLGGGACGLLAAALLTIGGFGSPNLSFLLEVAAPSVPVLCVVVVTLAFLALLAGTTLDRARS
jgi:hypothetical protein